MLLTQQGRIVTKGRLLRAVWGEAFQGEDDYVYVHVSSVRRKLNAAAPAIRAGSLIVTEPGVGYRVQPDEATGPGREDEAEPSGDPSGARPPASVRPSWCPGGCSGHEDDPCGGRCRSKPSWTASSASSTRQSCWSPPAPPRASSSRASGSAAPARSGNRLADEAGVRVVPLWTIDEQHLDIRVEAIEPVIERKVHVLLVEDDEGLRPILARHLACKGFRVAEAASAEEADVAARRRPATRPRAAGPQPSRRDRLGLPARHRPRPRRATRRWS